MGDICCLIVTVFENRVLGRMSRHGKEEEAGEWRKSQDGKFKNVYVSPDTAVVKLRGKGCSICSVNEKLYEFYGRKA
jgi:hypothetical protein